MRRQSGDVLKTSQSTKSGDEMAESGSRGVLIALIGLVGVVGAAVIGNLNAVQTVIGRLLADDEQSSRVASQAAVSTSPAAPPAKPVAPKPVRRSPPTPEEAFNLPVRKGMTWAEAKRAVPGSTDDFPNHTLSYSVKLFGQPFIIVHTLDANNRIVDTAITKKVSYSYQYDHTVGRVMNDPDETGDQQAVREACSDTAFNKLASALASHFGPPVLDPVQPHNAKGEIPLPSACTQLAFSFKCDRQGERIVRHGTYANLVELTTTEEMKSLQVRQYDYDIDTSARPLIYSKDKISRFCEWRIDLPKNGSFGPTQE
jgi:hypothetical protein